MEVQSKASVNSRSRLLQRLVYYYPLTVPGTLLLGVAAALARGALLTRNPYEFLLALLALFLLIVLAVVGRVQATRLNKKRLDWDSTNPVYAREVSVQWVHAESVRTLMFYRVHFCLAGKLAVGRSANLFYRQEVATSGGERVPIRLRMPLGGIFTAAGRLTLRDIFGLTRARIGAEYRRRIAVRPPAVTGTQMPALTTQQSMQSVARKRSSDEEKYYMREYVAGDRPRDINWKASGKLEELFTRISPVSEEKAKVVNIQLRNLVGGRKETLESIVHLDYLKGWLLSFVRTLKAEHPTHQFRIVTSEGLAVLESEEHIEHFALTLSSLRYTRDASGLSASLPTQGELFVFTTPYDTGLAVSYPANTTIHVYRTACPSQDEGQNEMLFRLFDSSPPYYTPGTWITARDRNPKETRLWPAEEVQHRSLRVKLF